MLLTIIGRGDNDFNAPRRADDTMIFSLKKLPTDSPHAASLTDYIDVRAYETEMAKLNAVRVQGQRMKTRVFFILCMPTSSEFESFEDFLQITALFQAFFYSS